MNPVAETGKTARSFFDIMRSDPLALSLVLINFLLMGFLYWSGAQRKDTVDLIVKWQERSDQLLASCVSADIMKLVLDALDRDRGGQSGRKPAEPEPPKQ